MSYFPTVLSDFQTYISGLINDPQNTRYPLTLINNFLDLAQHRWNSEAKICRLTDYVACTANVYRYQLSTNLTLMPLMIMRVTWKGIPLIIRSKEYMDKYSSIDWTTTIGTPQEVMIDLNSNNTGLSQTGPSIILHPVPQAGDVSSYTNNVGITNQNPLSIEYLAPHTTMVNPTDQAFTVNGTFINTSILPYVAGLALDVSASILEPDPTPETIQKAKIFRAQANAYLSLVIQMYQGLEEDAPLRFGGGRTVRPSGIASTS
jgi:hypothetical protein